jgi:hypothetical protein
MDQPAEMMNADNAKAIRRGKYPVGWLYLSGEDPAFISGGIYNCSLLVSMAGHNPPLR